MALPGKVYVAPMNTDHWLAKGWTELGYTTEDGVATEDEVGLAAVWALDSTKIPVPTLGNLENLTLACKAVSLSFKQMADAMRLHGFLFYASAYHKPEHLRRLRQMYRQKRGRRRFR